MLISLLLPPFALARSYAALLVRILGLMLRYALTPAILHATLFVLTTFCASLQLYCSSGDPLRAKYKAREA